MDLAIIVMVEIGLALDGISIGAYMGAYASISKVGMVGISGITMIAEDLKFEFNAGLRAYVGFDLIPTDANGDLAITADILNNLPSS